jgi:DNA-binding NtrC family response regulator
MNLLHPYAKNAHLPVRRSGNILCIDAEDESRLLVAEILYEHEVDFALTADDAVQLARVRSYALYFVDPAVPQFDDFDLFAELRAANRETPVVLCIGGRDTAGERLAAAVLPKPLAATAIRNTADRLLEDMLAGARQ